MRSSPEQLLSGVGTGDEKAFAELYEVLADRVYGLARRVVGDDTDAEDIAQEVFVQLWQTAPRYDPARGSVHSWVMTITHRRAVDKVRAVRTRRSHEAAASSPIDRFEADAWDPVGDHAQIAADAARLRRCILTRLTILQRQAIVLAYYHGHTYAEVARLLDTHPSTIKTRIRDGLRRLRTCLNDNPPAQSRHVVSTRW
ncbi:sigma-70 family RNA polymerase sigma factor [Tenggerimyces flavus]|uniref:Sigma-70 family RNA polymerase sigma factor n=1 Tax=Tenggerimyces flavus TaxID=1708749 RepID=A0ABV7Y3F7_9ACTN|nr:sigma-70 family RNA polymerase sigma factor [Tenggerimyces flavus]MBM7790092.1 RNA polymerase sigma-70 factor (ECF subfamily) [Tenggerimyces flavus]